MCLGILGRYLPKSDLSQCQVNCTKVHIQSSKFKHRKYSANAVICHNHHLAGGLLISVLVSSTQVDAALV